MKGFNFKTFKKTFFLFFQAEVFTNTSVRIRCFFATLLILVDVAVATLVPYCSKNIVDALALNVMNSVSITIGFLGFFWILEKTVNHIQEIIFFPVINKVIRNLSYRVVSHIHQISLPDYQKISIPEVISCIRRISLSARSFIKILFLMIVPTTIKLTIAIIVASKAGFFGLLLLPAIILAIFILYKGTKLYTTARERAWHATDAATMRINDSIINTKLVRFFQNFEMLSVGELLNTEAKCWHTTNTYLHTIHILIGILLGLTITGILVSTVYGIQNQTLTIGDFILIKGQLIAAFLPLKTLSIEFRQLAEALVDIKKIIKTLEIPKIYISSFLINPSRNPSRGIVLKNVSFSHDGKKAIFSDLSLQIPHNKKIAIVGESGCGKSSLLSLIASLYKPSQGSITIDDQDISQLPKEIINKRIHFIPQDLHLFNASLRYNICYGSQEISEAKLLEVVEQVGLTELLLQMPEGLDSNVGEMGTKLSGGEKQKVALARALLLNPEILLMDETLNALNHENEKRILGVLFNTIPTIILASHRASTLSYVDWIFKIHGGRIFCVDNANRIDNHLVLPNTQSET